MIRPPSGSPEASEAHSLQGRPRTGSSSVQSHGHSQTAGPRTNIRNHRPSSDVGLLGLRARGGHTWHVLEPMRQWRLCRHPASTSVEPYIECSGDRFQGFEAWSGNSCSRHMHHPHNHQHDDDHHHPHFRDHHHVFVMHAKGKLFGFYSASGHENLRKTTLSTPSIVVGSLKQP